MSVAGRSSFFKALKESKGLQVLVPAMLTAVQSIQAISMVYQQVATSELGGSLIKEPSMKKMIQKKRWNRKAKKPNKKFTRPAWRCGVNDDLTEDGSFDEEEVGLTREEFDLVLACVMTAVECERSKDGAKKRVSSLSVEAGVALTLEFLKSAETPRKIAKKYKIPKSTVDRVLHYYMIRLRATLDFIGDENTGINFTAGRFNTEGSIDCSTHPRDRVHPGEDQYYRSDKGIHFLTSQAVIDHLGYYFRMTVASGHNNDQGLTHITQLAAFMERFKIQRLLADLGYSGDLFVRPISMEQQLIQGVDAYLRQAVKDQAAERSLVEHVNSWVKNWKFAEKKCKMGPEMQAIGLIVCAQLHQITLMGVERAQNRAELLNRSN
jgi:hypothetical protein